MKATDLTSFELFNNVPLELINSVLANCSVYTIPAGQHLIKKDVKNSALYLLLEGEVQIYLEEDKPLRII